MTTKELISLADQELDSRQLRRPQIRRKAVRKVVEFMEDTGSFLNGKELALPSNKKIVENAFSQYYSKTLYGLSGAINIIYQVSEKAIGTSMALKLAPKSVINPSLAIPALSTVKDAENALIKGKFVSVKSIDENSVPTFAGLYCIKLCKGVILPGKYGKVREDGVIYIGKANKLRERLWMEELNLKRPATFFRGIGTILGYLPPKGSLASRSNQNNYVFSPEDTESIKKWIRQSLLVNWVRLEQTQIMNIEKSLINTYQPLMNTTHNPNPSKELAAARKRCREYAKS